MKNKTTYDEKNDIWFPFMKPNRKRHDSGYKCFNIGYVRVAGSKAVEKKIIGSYTDHIWTAYYGEGRDYAHFSMDVLDGGEIRFHDMDRQLRWSGGGYALSSMHIEHGEPIFKKE